LSPSNVATQDDAQAHEAWLDWFAAPASFKTVVLECYSRAILALTQIWCNSNRADQAGLEEIDLPSAIHLAFDELELSDPTFGLLIRPRQDDRGADGTSYDGVSRAPT
jgi:hypothetical protein